MASPETAPAAPSTQVRPGSPQRIGDLAGDLLARWKSLDVESDEDAEAKARAAAEAEYQERRSRCWRVIHEDLGARHEQCTLKNYQRYHPAQSAVVERLEALRRRLVDWAKRGGQLFLYGPTGTGKDHLAVSLLRELAHFGVSVRWKNGQLLYDQIARAYQDDTKVDAVLQPLRSPKVLCLSDPVLPFGMTEPNKRALYRIVCDRYDRGLATWVTLNASSHESARSLLEAQTYSRLMDRSEAVFCNWPDFRSRNQSNASAG